MKKEEIISFKADTYLLEELNRIPNRSAFIRKAVMLALENTCPLCQGTGLLTPSQMRHWNTFTRHHSPQICGECKETILTCDLEKREQ
ncbi:MAG: CopG family transcriptional regulator [Sediminispirochaetaceae bacterium]